MPGPRRKKKLLDSNPPSLVLPDYCTEAYVQDWFEYGFQLLCGLLAKYAQFADYLLAHPELDDPAID